MTQPEASPLNIEDNGDHIVIVNDNPKQMNTLSLEYHTLLLDGLKMAAETDRITSVILVGRSGYFSAGGNLNLLATTLDDTGRETRDGIVAELQDCVRAIQSCPKPVISAVHGGAAGGGFSLAMSCDLIVCDEEAVFVPAYVKIGAVPDGGLTHSLATSLPHALAMEICLFGKPVTAKMLKQFGLVNVLCAEGQAEAEATALAGRLARGPMATQGQIKQLLRAARTNTIDQQLDLERHTLVELLGTPTAKEGITAFLEKRRPDFAAAEGRLDT